MQKTNRLTMFYSPFVAFAFMVNFMLGTGVLTLPYAFNAGGVILASGFVFFFCAIAYLTATFELEAMSIANALRYHRGNPSPDAEAKGKDVTISTTSKDDDEDASIFSLRERVELAEMLELFFGDSECDAIDAPVERSADYLSTWWTWRKRRNAFVPYACNLLLIIYLNGTMATYAALIASTFKNITTDSMFGVDAYYVFMIATVIVGAPLSFGNFQSTKYFQVFIMVVRMSVFLIMLITTAVYFFRGDSENDDDDHRKDADYYANPNGIASLYGNIVFTFMTHHSLPGLLSPIRPQRSIKTTLFASLAFCCVAYVLLCIFGMFAFWSAPITDSDRCGDNSEPCQIMKTYNINFSSYHVKWVGKYIEGYPLLMLMLFPLVAITLRNNIRDFVRLLARTRKGEVGNPLTSPFLVRRHDDDDDDDDDDAKQLQRATTMAIHRRTNTSRSNVIYTFAAILPGVAIATAVRNVQDITHYTGGFAGLFVMLVTPAILVLRGRFVLRSEGLDDRYNLLASPFKHNGWAYAILVFAACCFAYTTFNVATGK